MKKILCILSKIFAEIFSSQYPGSTAAPGNNSATPANSSRPLPGAWWPVSEQIVAVLLDLSQTILVTCGPNPKSSNYDIYETYILRSMISTLMYISILSFIIYPLLLALGQCERCCPPCTLHVRHQQTKSCCPALLSCSQQSSGQSDRVLVTWNLCCRYSIITYIQWIQWFERILIKLSIICHHILW